MRKYANYMGLLGVLGTVLCDPCTSAQVERMNHEEAKSAFHHKALKEQEVIKKNANFVEFSEAEAFIEKGVQSYPLGRENFDQARKYLEKRDIYLNPNKIVDKASSGDPDYLGLIGSAYASNFRIPLALPWFFAAAKRNSADALWSLSGLVRKGFIPSENAIIAGQLAAQLKEKAISLKPKGYFEP